jgi:hypothetical protein
MHFMYWWNSCNNVWFVGLGTEEIWVTVVVSLTGNLNYPPCLSIYKTNSAIWTRITSGFGGMRDKFDPIPQPNTATINWSHGPRSFLNYYNEGSGPEVSAMESLLKKDSNLSIEHCSFKGFALLDNGKRYQIYTQFSWLDWFCGLRMYWNEKLK